MQEQKIAEIKAAYQSYVDDKENLLGLVEIKMKNQASLLDHIDLDIVSKSFDAQGFNILISTTSKKIKEYPNQHHLTVSLIDKSVLFPPLKYKCDVGNINTEKINTEVLRIYREGMDVLDPNHLFK